MLLVNLESTKSDLIVEAAFVFFSVEAGFLCRHSFFDRAGGVPVAHGYVALAAEGMSRDLVVLEEVFNLGVRPIKDRIGFEALSLGFQEFAISTGLRLAAT